jgi:hypothetical protein
MESTNSSGWEAIFVHKDGEAFLTTVGGLDNIHGALQVEAMAARNEISIGINMVWIFVREAYFGGIKL